MSLFPIKIDIYSDQICPWCFIGKRKLEMAIASFVEKNEYEFTIEWHPYLLQPRIPPNGIDRGEPERNSTKKPTAMSEEAEKVGLKFGRIRYIANTVNAHRLIDLAKTSFGLKQQNDLVDVCFICLLLLVFCSDKNKIRKSLFTAYFVDSQNVSESSVLIEYANKIGLWNNEEDRQMLRKFLDSDNENNNNHIHKVMNDIAEATNTHAVTGVPLFIFNQSFKMPGAQDAAVFHNLFKRLKERNIRSSL